MIEYPAHREAHVALKDGSTLQIRPIRSDDQVRLLAFLRALSPDSLALRFFGGGTDLEGAARRESGIDYRDRFGLIATVGEDQRIVGHASYALLAADRAEAAFMVADDFQGRGLGTILLTHLAEIAAANGITVFEAEVLPVNYRMLGVFRQSGFPIEVRLRYGELHVTFPTSFTDQAIARFEQREQIAAVNALRAFLNPRSVAAIGASRQRGSIGGELFHNLLGFGFNGPVYPVNSTAEVVQSVVAYPSVEAIPGPVDLAVVAVPARAVLEVAEACARKGVRALVVVSAGFAEVGDQGRQRQADLVKVCRASGMRLIGPNCIGIANTDPAVMLHATFGPLAPPAGRVGLSSQSGALGLAAVDYAESIGMGLSSFVSIGNKADISSNDLLNYWESDPRTSVILLYLESFGNPRRFTRIARRVARAKPIVVVKSGRSVAGARASATHTGTLIGASDVTVGALFRQAGVIRTDTMEELFDVASLLANQPLPRGRRVGIVSNVGGPAILCADAAEANGLEVPLLAEETRARLYEFLPPEASVDNPVDMIASASAEQYGRAIRLVADDPNVDAVIAIFIPPLATLAADVAREIVGAASALQGRLPLLSVFMATRGFPAELTTPELCVPSFTFPESAAIALAHAAHYGEWRASPPPSEARLEGLERDAAAAIVAQALGRGGGWLEPREVVELLGCYGLSLSDSDRAVAEWPGVPMSVRLAHDPQFGPVIACGAGGDLAELFQDLSVRLSPLTREDAREMVGGLRSYPLLSGFRGAPLADIAALEDMLLRVSALAEDLPRVAEIDCSPLVVQQQGLRIVEARIRVEAGDPPRPLGARR